MTGKMTEQEVFRIANRHIARCLSRIEEVHNLPELCAESVRKEMHFCAQDVAALATKQGDGYERHKEV